jgi:hypothetical protein
MNVVPNTNLAAFLKYNTHSEQTLCSAYIADKLRVISRRSILKSKHRPANAASVGIPIPVSVAHDASVGIRTGRRRSFQVPGVEPTTLATGSACTKTGVTKAMNDDLRDDRSSALTPGSL